MKTKNSISNAIMQSVLITVAFFYTTIVFSQNIENVKNTVKELSSEKFKGRSVVFEGDKLTAQWISEKFQVSGLKKFNSNYFQKFQVSLNTFPGKLNLSIDNKLLKPGNDYYIRLSCPDTVASFDIIYFADEELSAEKANKLTKEDLSNKALVVDMDYIYENYKKLDTAISKIFRKKIGALIYLSSNTIRWYEVYGTRIIHTIMIDMKRTSFDRKAKKLNVEVEAEFKTNYETQNVVGFIEGKQIPEKYLIICGHYDHLGYMGKDIIFPGADDNASAIGVMVELASYFSKKENQPNCSLIFAAFSAEEMGLNGAEHFVKNLPVPKEKIIEVLNLDMVAFGKDSFIVFNGVEQQEIFQKLNKHAKSNNININFMAKNNIPDSDHYPFTKEKIPAVFLTSGTKDSPNYHTPRDTYENATFSKINELMKLIISNVKSID